MSNPQQPQQQQQSKKTAQTNTSLVLKKGTPMIVERINRIPMVNFAISVGFSQYDKLKSSNVTVGQVMTRAENLAAYFWTKVQPVVEKLQDPINKADQLACDTIDYVENKIQSITSAASTTTTTATAQQQQQKS